MTVPLSRREPPVEEAPSGADDWVGVWGRQGLPRLEEELLAAPTIACKEQLVAPSYSRHSLLCRPTREAAAGRGGA